MKIFAVALLLAACNASSCQSLVGPKDPPTPPPPADAGADPCPPYCDHIHAIGCSVWNPNCVESCRRLRANLIRDGQRLPDYVCQKRAESCAVAGECR